MIYIPIANIPNQTLSIALNGSQYDLRIVACGDNVVPGTMVMAVDIVRDNAPIVTGVRALPDFPLIPARYLEDGNFLLTTQNDEYPDWNFFGVTQYLVYASETELQTFRAAA